MACNRQDLLSEKDVKKSPKKTKITANKSRLTSQWLGYELFLFIILVMLLLFLDFSGFFLLLIFFLFPSFVVADDFDDLVFAAEATVPLLAFL